MRNQIVSLSADLRAIEWQLHGPDSDYEFPDPNDRFYGQHTAAQLGNGNVLLFDNGWGRPAAEGGRYSRALELRLDAAGRHCGESVGIPADAGRLHEGQGQRVPAAQRQYPDQLP